MVIASISAAGIFPFRTASRISIPPDSFCPSLLKTTDRLVWDKSRHRPINCAEAWPPRFINPTANSESIGSDSPRTSAPSNIAWSSVQVEPIREASRFTPASTSPASTWVGSSWYRRKHSRAEFRIRPIADSSKPEASADANCLAKR